MQASPSDREPLRERVRAYTVYTALGASATLAQVLLLRGLLNRFGGNELLIGTGFFAWLALGALGALGAGRLRRTFALSSFAALALLPLAVYAGLALLDWRLPGSLPGLDATPPAMLAVSLLSVLPAAAISGALFVLLIGQARARFAHTLSRLIFFESLGAALGGLLFGTLLIHRLGQEGLLTLLALSVAIGVLTFPAGRFVPRAALAGLALASAALPLSPGFTPQGFTRLDTLENGHGVFVALERAGQVTIAQGHRPLIDCDVDERSERIAALVLGLRPAAPRVVQLSGALVDLSAVMRSRVPAVLSVSDNPELQRFESRHCTRAKSVAQDPRFSLLQGDPRVVCAEACQAGDVLLIDLGAPDTIAASRMASRSFFLSAASSLAAPDHSHNDGLLLLGLMPATSYITDSEAALMHSILKAARPAFAHCHAFALERWWLACSDTALDLSPDALLSNIARHDIELKSVSESALGAWLDPFRAAMLADALKRPVAESVRANSDDAPIAPLHALTLWLARYDPQAAQALAFVVARRHLLFAVALLLFAFAVLTVRARRTLAAGLTVGVVGGAGITVEIMVMTLYQAGHGALLERLGGLVAAYMIGLGLGAWWAERAAARVKPKLLLLTLALLCGFVAGIGADLFGGALSDAAAYPLALMLLIVCAALAGALFQTLAMRTARRSVDIRRLTAWLRGADTAAAALAALVVGVLAIPLFGVTWTGLMAGVLCATLLLLRV